MEIAENRKPEGSWIIWPMCSFLSLWHKKDLMLRELVFIVILTTTVEVDIMSGLIDLIFFLKN
jgi:hypothetical protein